MNPNQPRCYSYVRISRAVQQKGHGIERQIAASSEWAEQHGMELDQSLTLQDIGKSAFRGMNFTRGALGEFRRLLEDGTVPKGSVLLVESLDRLDRRSLRESMPAFLDLINAGCKVITLCDNMEYDSENLDLQNLVMSLMILSRAHEESKMKSERTRKANEKRLARARDGESVVPSASPSWLTYDRKRLEWVIDQSKADIVRRLFRDFSNGVTPYRIAQSLQREGIKSFRGKDAWSTTQIRRLLKSKNTIGVYSPHKRVDGERVPSGEPIKGYYPAIVDETLFYSVQNKFALMPSGDRGGAKKSDEMANLFSGLAYCPHCDGKLVYNLKNRERNLRYLICRNVSCGTCKYRSWKYEDFESTVLRYIRNELDIEVLTGDTRREEGLLKHREKLDSIKEQIKELENEISGFVRNMAVVSEDTAKDIDAQLAVVRARRNDLREQIEPLESELDRFTHAVGNAEEKKRAIDSLIDNMDSRTTGDKTNLRRKLRSQIIGIIERITPFIDEKLIEIEFRSGVSRTIAEMESGEFFIILESGDQQLICEIPHESGIPTRYTVDFSELPNITATISPEGRGYDEKAFDNLQSWIGQRQSNAQANAS